ncbi:AAA family ATPase [Nanoarchaeota archaeon]
MIFEELRKEILSNKDPYRDILGQNEVKKQLSSALLAGRHLILVGPPGVGKTTLAKNIAKLLGSVEISEGYGKEKKKKIIEGLKRIVRVQGSPDLTVEDLLGDIDPIKALKYGPLSLEAFTPGKIFKADKGILFLDEINRCPEKLQNSLLQVLEEGKATLGSYEVDFPVSLIFIATMNPEDTSTEKLSDVLLDRFDLINVGYPESLEVEQKIVTEKGKTFDVSFPANLLTMSIHFVRLLRVHDKIEKRPGVRATIGLYERAQTNAEINGRKKVTFDDVADSVASVIAHRIRLKPSVKYLQSPEEFIAKEFREFVRDHGDSYQVEKGGDG